MLHARHENLRKFRFVYRFAEYRFAEDDCCCLEFFPICLLVDQGVPQNPHERLLARTWVALMVVVRPTCACSPAGTSMVGHASGEIWDLTTGVASSKLPSPSMVREDTTTYSTRDRNRIRIRELAPCGKDTGETPSAILPLSPEPLSERTNERTNG